MRPEVEYSRVGRQQAALDFDFPIAPIPQVVDEQVPLEDRPVLAGHNAIILDALRRGPASGPELERLLGPGSAWRTRVSDVRRWLERGGETVKPRRVEPRLWVYRIEVLR